MKTCSSCPKIPAGLGVIRCSDFGAPRFHQIETECLPTHQNTVQQNCTQPRHNQCGKISKQVAQKEANTETNQITRQHMFVNINFSETTILGGLFSSFAGDSPYYIY